MSKLGFYLKGFGDYLLPDAMVRRRRNRYENTLSDERMAELRERVEYYCRLADDASLDSDIATKVADFKFPWRSKKRFATYFFDLYSSIRLQDADARFCYRFGDLNYETELPCLVKSRPINRRIDARSNSVLVRLNSYRHFRYYDDVTPWLRKRDMLVMRNATDDMPHRKAFVRHFANHPMCDVGHTNHAVIPSEEPFRRPFMKPSDMLGYKFIACLEGNDVATALKWVMASNSLAVMPRPKVESWFMEGTLLGGEHYIEIADDYSDLGDRLEYYLERPKLSAELVENAHRYVARFREERFEQAVQDATVERYFEHIRMLSRP